MAGGTGLVHAAERGEEGLIAKAAAGALREAEGVFGKRAAKDGLEGGAKDILKRREADAVEALGHEGTEAAQRVAARASQSVEWITGDLERVVGSTPGAEFVGKEFRLKQLDSLERKIAGDVAESNGTKTAAQAADGINDAVRYTIKSSSEDYSRVAQESIDKLKAAGYEPVNVKNFWGQEGYQGINSTWRDASGQTFELQFHTAESLEAKEATHGIYEMARVFPKSDPIVGELRGIQNRVFTPDFVPRPPGAAGVG